MFSLCPLANHIRGPARQHTGHSSAHKYSEGRIFCHPEWEKGVTGSSTFCLWILSSTQYLCMQNGVFSRALRFDLHQTQRGREGFWWRKLMFASQSSPFPTVLFSSTVRKRSWKASGVRSPVWLHPMVLSQRRRHVSVSNRDWTQKCVLHGQYVAGSL